MKQFLLVVAAITTTTLGALLLAKSTNARMEIGEPHTEQASPKTPEECHEKYNSKTLTNDVIKCINKIGQ